MQLGPQTHGWRKSSHSPHDPDDCVEAGGFDNVIAIRDTAQNGKGDVLIIDRTDFARLLSSVKAIA